MTEDEIIQGATIIAHKVADDNVSEINSKIQINSIISRLDGRSSRSGRRS